MSSLVVIGGSRSHVPFIEAARRLGYTTVVFDRDPSSPGAALADKFYAISTHDIEGMGRVCERLNRETTLSGIVTYSAYSRPLMAVATLCDRFGLPSFSVESLMFVLDKGEMKKRFEKSGVPCPQSVTVGPGEGLLSDCPLPVIVKPRSGTQGSSGVSIVREREAFKDSLDDASRVSEDGFAVIESYCEGRQFSVDGIVGSEDPVIISVSEKFNLGPEANFTISGFATGRVPDADEELTGAMASICSVAMAAVRSLDITNSFFSVDVILTGNGPVVLECGVLLDAKIDRLLYFAGVDVYGMICRVATGQMVGAVGPCFSGAYALKFMFARREGRLKTVESDGFGPEYKGRRVAVEWERVTGDPVMPPRSIADTVGWVVTEGNDQGDAYRRACDTAGQVMFRVI